MSLTKKSIREKAGELGIDLAGFTSWQDLEPFAHDYDKPSNQSTHLGTLIVLARRILVGVSTAKDRALQQYALGRTLQRLEEDAVRLAFWLEEQDVMAAVLSTLVPDPRTQPRGFASPAAQGSYLIRQGAVRAGLGSLGMNTMLLTPQFGPRVFLAGLLTDLEIEADAPFTEELCPGLEACGRCAKACPVGAIPLVAPPAAVLSDYRDIDAEACARECQPYGSQAFVEHLKMIAQAGSPEERARAARDTATQQFHHSMTILRQGAFTGCMRCEVVCPIGADYPKIEKRLED